MDKISDDPAVQAAGVIHTLTEVNERECLAKLAREVPIGGKVMEIGALLGGVTAVLALANPGAHITTIDNFSWRPDDQMQTSAEIVMANMKKVGVRNVVVITGDSKKLGGPQTAPIDLVWIDGGHEYDQAFSDLVLFGLRSKVIAIHDYDNPWLTIHKAVDDFIVFTGGAFKLTELVHWTAVLRRVDESNQ
jgi:predicted O-methyltransferase YrrM